MFFLFVTQCGTAWSVSHAPQVDAGRNGLFLLGCCWLCFRHQLTYLHGLKWSWISLWGGAFSRFNQVLRSDFSVAYQESVSDHLLDWQPMKSGSSPPGETPCVTVCLLRRTVFFFHWQSMTLTLTVSGLCRTGLKNNQFNYEGIFVFCFRKKRRRKRTLPSRVTSVFLGPRAMNHSCNVSWQFWSEADWAGEFQNKQKKKKKASAITANTHGHKKSLAAPVCLLAKQESGNLLSGTINVKHRNRLDTLKNLPLVNSHERNSATDLLYIFALCWYFFWGGTKNIKFSRVQSVRATVQWNNRKDATFMIWINRSTFYL